MPRKEMRTKVRKKTEANARPTATLAAVPEGGGVNTLAKASLGKADVSDPEVSATSSADSNTSQTVNRSECGDGAVDIACVGMPGTGACTCHELHSMLAAVMVSPSMPKNKLGPSKLSDDVA